MRDIAILLLRLYKYLLSPMLPVACRYTPTCSEYAMEAVAQYGVVRGVAKAVWRVLRCHPFSKGGLDPVASRTQHSATCALPHLGVSQQE